jgi:hypothetical protein
MIPAKDMRDRLIAVQKFYNEQLVIETEIAMLKAIADCKNPFVEITEWNGYLVNKLSDAGYIVEGDLSQKNGFLRIWWSMKK